MIRLLDRKHRDREEQPAPSPTPAEKPSTPSLLLLTDDAAGPAVRRLHPFAACDDADDFVRFWFPPTRRDGLIAFWALHQRPAPDDAVTEAAVLVRNPADPGLVYTFSFVDMESALAFLRDEAGYGLDLACVLLFWALPVAIDTSDPDAVVFAPSTPPAPAAAEELAPEPDQPQAPQPSGEPARPTAPAPVPAPAPAMRGADAFLRDVAGVLRSRRWEQRQEAFQGFGSPPGRF